MVAHAILYAACGTQSLPSFATQNDSENPQRKGALRLKTCIFRFKSVNSHMLLLRRESFCSVHNAMLSDLVIGVLFLSV